VLSLAACFLDAEVKEDEMMITKRRAVRVFGTATLAFLVLAAACATVQEVKVSYRLPEPGSALEGRKVYIDFQDEREAPEILTPAAREEYTYHSGNVDLSVSRDGEPTVEGLKDVPSLFRDVFAMRIRRLGGEVVPLERSADVSLTVALETFSLDLQERTWKAWMAYELLVSLDERIRARQEITGEAERVKIFGLKQADELMGDLFTDVVNRPDLAELFAKAGLS
jgi:hypothetical protein